MFFIYRQIKTKRRTFVSNGGDASKECTLGRNKLISNDRCKIRDEKEQRMW